MPLQVKQLLSFFLFLYRVTESQRIFKPINCHTSLLEIRKLNYSRTLREFYCFQLQCVAICLYSNFYFNVARQHDLSEDI